MGKSLRRAYLTDLVAGVRELDSETSRYINSVLRLQRDDEIEFFDGCGRSSQGRIIELNKRSVHVELAPPELCPPQAPEVNLYCAIPKGDRVEWLLEKCSELGASSIIWVIYERSQDHRKDYTKRYDRWHKIACEAARQSHNTWIPKLIGPKPFESVVEATQSTRTRVVLDTMSETIPLAKLRFQTNHPIELMIGPEGGFSDAERNRLKEHKWIPTSLGETVLRIETAAMAGIVGIRTHGSLLDEDKGI